MTTARGRQWAGRGWEGEVIYKVVARASKSIALLSLKRRMRKNPQGRIQANGICIARMSWAPEEMSRQIKVNKQRIADELFEKLTSADRRQRRRIACHN